MEQKPIRQENVHKEDELTSRERFVQKTSNEQILELYDKAQESLSETKKINKAVDWIQTITYLGFVIVIVTMLGTAIDVFFYMHPNDSTPQINIYETH